MTAKENPAIQELGGRGSTGREDSKASCSTPDYSTPMGDLQPYQRHVPSVDEVPPELRDLPIWCAWKLVHKDGKAKPDKVPVSAVNGGSKWGAPGFGTTAEAAIAYAETHTETQGIGFILDSNQGLSGGDLDDCRDLSTGVPTDTAHALIAEAETYTEVSPGLAGYRFIIFGDFGGHTGRDRDTGVELYEGARFLTFTGLQVPETPFCVERRDLSAMGARYFSKQKANGDHCPTPGATEAPAVDSVNIPARTRRWIEEGPPSDADRSNIVFGAAKDLLRAGVTAPDTLSILSAYPIGACAMERRSGDVDSARQWLWKYAVEPAEREIADEGDNVDSPEAQFDDLPPAVGGNDESHPDLSHDELALQLGRLGGWNERARYVAPWDRWLFWDGSRWFVDDRLRHMTEVRAFLRKVAKDLERWAKRKSTGCTPAEAEKMMKWARGEAKTLRQAGSRTSVENMARSNPELAATVEQWDGCLDLLGTPGGTVDLRTEALRAPDRHDYITRHTAVTPVSGKPSLWLRFLHTAMQGDGEMVAFLQRLAGYMLTGHTSEHKLPFAFGPGGNGKSVFANTLHGITADYGARAPAEAFLSSKGERHPTDLAGLQGARLVIGSELPAGRAWNESVIKDLTGGDPITARFMRQDFFTYTPQFTLLIVGNHQPSIGAVDEAMRRRLLLIPFTATIPDTEKDPALEQKLRAEHGAILQWMIEGAVEWYQHGLCVPGSVTRATDDYLEAEDTLGQFIADELEPDSQEKVLSSHVYERHKTWCGEHGAREWSQRALTQALRERGCQIHKDRQGRHLAGYRLRERGIPARQR